MKKPVFYAVVDTVCGCLQSVKFLSISVFVAGSQSGLRFFTEMKTC